VSLHHFNGQCAALIRLRLPLSMAKYAGITAGALGDTIADIQEDYVDLSGKPVDPAKVMLTRLGLADFPEIVRKDQLPTLLGNAQGNPPVAPATPVLSKQSAISGPVEDLPREAPEWRPPPPSHRSSQPAAGSGEVMQREQIPGDNEPQVGSGSGGGGSLSHAGAEVSVPDQTPQRQAMNLYDVPSSDVGNIWEHYDRRLQNPATNSIIRFVSE
jgi:hypothetical protein